MLGLDALANDARLVAVHHGDDALHEVAQLVTQFVVVGIFKLFVGEITILLGGDIPCKEIPKRIETVLVDDL